MTAAALKILVIGSAGQLAQSLVAADRSGANAIPVVLTAIGRPGIDLARPETIAVACDRVAPDVIVNTAAMTAVDQAETDVEAAWAVNATGAGHVAQIAAARGCPLIHISTDYVFDGCKRTPYGEDDLPAPRNVYGQSKLVGEHEVAAAYARHIILRTSWVYSPFGRNFAKTMLRLARTNDEIRVVDDQIGTPTYAPHLADAIIKLAQHARANAFDVPWGLYHAAGQGATSWCGLAQAVFRRRRERGGGAPRVIAISTRDYPTPARRPRNSQLDSTRLQQTFGIALPDWQSGVADCIRRIRDDEAITPAHDTGGEMVQPERVGE